MSLNWTRPSCSWYELQSWSRAWESARSDVTYVQLPGSTPTAASFEFRDEGHTLGNALRYIIMKKWVALPLVHVHP